MATKPRSQRTSTVSASGDNVNTPSPAFSAMAGYWALPEALLGGTEAMRAQKEKYLPQYEAESKKNYTARLAMTVLRNFYRRTLINLSNKMTPKPIVQDAALPSQLSAYMQNVDLAGRNVDVFAQAVARAMIQEGLSFILTDFNAAAPARSLGEERAMGARPYWIHIKASQVRGIKYEIRNGKLFVTEFRYARQVTGKDDAGNETAIDEVYVLRPSEWERWRIGPDGKWFIPPDNETEKFKGGNTLERVALVAVYTGYVAPFEAVPPLDDLAWMNLEHWQLRSDQRNALNVASFPILACSGYNPGQGENGKITIGPRAFLYTTDAQGKFYFVEHTGTAIEAGAKELATLEEQMRSYGLQFEVKTKEAETATGRRLDYSEAMAPVFAWALGLEQGLNEALRDMAEWDKLTLTADKKYLSLNADENQPITEAHELTALVETRKARDISRPAYLHELQRRGILSDDYDAEADSELLASESETMFADNFGGTAQPGDQVDENGDPLPPDPNA